MENGQNTNTTVVSPDQVKVVGPAETRSAKFAEGIINEDGQINGRQLARQMGALIQDVLSGAVPTNRAHVVARTHSNILRLADTARRCAQDGGTPILQLKSGE
jgi:hypothetical protein